MKKQTFFSFLLIMLMSMIGDSSFAHDIEAKNADGVTIYYNWTNNETELAVTFRGSSETQYSSEYTGDVVIPESVNYNGITYPVTSIGKRAFWGCSRLASISIPNSVLEIGASSFNGCSQLTSVTIGNSVESIGRGAFFDCKNLPSIVIPKSVTQIDNNIFMNCFSLSHIVVEEGNTVYDSRENCNAIVEKNNNELISGCVNTFIPNSVISIGPNAFSGSSLTSIDIPYSVLSIGDEAFSGCYRLTSIVIPNSVETIGSNRVFRGCRQLTSIVIPDKVPYIGFWAFEECNNLQSVTIGKNVKTIYQGAFNSCTNLKDLYCKANMIPTSSSSSFEQTNIGIITLHVPESSLDLYRATEPWSLFGDIVALSEEPTNLGCIGRDGLWYELTITGDEATAVVYEPMDSKPTGDLVIPNSIVSGGRAFNVVGIRTLRNCDGLTSVTISEGVTKINRAAFDGCTNLKTVNLPESLEEIGDYAFYNLSKLENVNIPKNVSYIGDEAFCECNSLNIQVEDLDGWLDIILSTTSSEYPFDKNCNLHLFKDGQETVDLVIPNGVESIRDRAFYRFTALSSISIPNSVLTIGTNAFNGCNNVTDVYIDKEEPLTIGSATFSGSSKATLHVPLGCKQAYGAADYWKGFKDVVEVTDRCPTPTISI